MFSRLENYFKTAQRRTEAADTRMRIRRDEQRVDDRKKRENRARADDELWQDSMDVTVQGLIAFLKGLNPQETANVAAPAESSTSRDEDRHNKRQDESPPPAPQNPQTSRAAQAYETTQQRTAPPQTQHVKPDHSSTVPAGVTLTEEDYREISRLIADLEKISAAGTQTLTIERSNSLLYSLRQAVNDALGR